MTTALSVESAYVGYTCACVVAKTEIKNFALVIILMAKDTLNYEL